VFFGASVSLRQGEKDDHRDAKLSEVGLQMDSLPIPVIRAWVDDELKCPVGWLVHSIFIAVHNKFELFPLSGC
jgi:hypothetical protein